MLKFKNNLMIKPGSTFIKTRNFLNLSLHRVLGKNNLGIILGSKSKNFKNFEARQKIMYSYKKVCKSMGLRFAYMMHNL